MLCVNTTLHVVYLFPSKHHKHSLGHCCWAYVQFRTLDGLSSTVNDQCLHSLGVVLELNHVCPPLCRKVCIYESLTIYRHLEEKGFSYGMHEDYYEEIAQPFYHLMMLKQYLLPTCTPFSLQRESLQILMRGFFTMLFLAMINLV